MNLLRNILLALCSAFLLLLLALILLVLLAPGDWAAR